MGANGNGTLWIGLEPRAKEKISFFTPAEALRNIIIQSDSTGGGAHL